MPKRIKDKNKSIFVKFQENLSDKDVSKFLGSMGISGVRVSSLINRWAIEIPFWRENYFVEKISNSEMTVAIHENFDKKKKTIEIEENEEVQNDE